MHTVGQLKDSVSGLLQGTNLNNVTNLNGAIERAARTLCQQADVPEASGRQTLILYDGVFDYAAPLTLFGTALIDVRPQGVSRLTTDFPYKRPLVLFDRIKNWQANGVSLTVEYNKGIGILRASSADVTQRIILDSMSETTGWTAAGSASNLVQDSETFYMSPASLRFLLTGASTGTLTKSINSNDLTAYQAVGVIFLPVFIPAGAAGNVTSVTIRLGSDASNYYSVVVTTGFLDSFTSGEWNLLAFDLSTATTVGTPVITAIDYTQILIAHTATITNFRTGGLWISLPFQSKILFQSSAIFMASGSDPSLTITDDDDQIILNEAAYTLFEHETALTIALQGGGKLASGLVQILRAILHGSGSDIGLYAEYRGDNPSQELRTVGNYYND